MVVCKENYKLLQGIKMANFLKWLLTNQSLLSINHNYLLIILIKQNLKKAWTFKRFKQKNEKYQKIRIFNYFFFI